MRELTAYEKKKWFDEYDRFEVPDFLGEAGDEWGEMMTALMSLVDCGTDYGLSEEFYNLAIVEYLDHYYDQIYYIYMGDWGYDTPEQYGLPPIDLVMKRQDRAMELGVDKLTAVRMALDWARKWQEDHRLETHKAQRRVALLQELAQLGD